MMRWIVLVLLGGCYTAPLNPIQDIVTTPEPAATAADAVSGGESLLGDTDLTTFADWDPVVLAPGQTHSRAGTLLSPREVARYSLLDTRAQEWRVRALTYSWQLARTERRFAEYSSALERHVQRLETLRERRRRMIYVTSAVSFSVGAVLSTVLTVRVLR